MVTLWRSWQRVSNNLCGYLKEGAPWTFKEQLFAIPLKRPIQICEKVPQKNFPSAVGIFTSSDNLFMGDGSIDLRVDRPTKLFWLSHSFNWILRWNKILYLNLIGYFFKQNLFCINHYCNNVQKKPISYKCIFKRFDQCHWESVNIQNVNKK